MNLADLPSFHVGVAAEAFTAALFARCGYDVSVQYGANQPEYDLIVTRGASVLKVSVKGSKEENWGLTQSHLQNANYHAAAETWLARHGPRTVYALVLFVNDDPVIMPRAYLATPRQIADRLKATARNRGDTILYERKVWSSRAYGAGTIDEIPASWTFSSKRIEQFLAAATL
jgi:Holliday junction resolvase-like predicted endonuclease